MGNRDAFLQAIVDALLYLVIVIHTFIPELGGALRVVWSGVSSQRGDFP